MAEVALLTIKRADGSMLPVTCISASGYKWTSNDVHSEQSGRTMDAVMHVFRIGTKDQLDVLCVPVIQTVAQELLLALREQAEFVCTYLTPEYSAQRTATFYCSSRNCEFLAHIRGVKWWKKIKFTLTEC